MNNYLGGSVQVCQRLYLSLENTTKDVYWMIFSMKAVRHLDAK